MAKKALVTSLMETWYLVQGFTADQIQPLAKAIYSLNNNGKSDTFISDVTGLFVHNSSINSGFWIAEQLISLHLIHNFSHTLHHHLF